MTQDVQAVFERISQLPLHEQKELLSMLEEYGSMRDLDLAREKFIHFVRRLWRPEFVEGRHHREMAKIQDAIVKGELKRVAINLGPRHPVWVGHRVTIADGSIKTVGDVEVGDFLITKEGRPRRVRGVFEQGQLPTVKITTKLGRHLYAHHSHPFLTPNGWVDAGDLKPQMTLAVVKNHAIEPSAKVSDEEARLLGYLIGDGSIGKISGVGITIDYREEREIADVDRCCRALGFTLRKQKRKHGWGVVKEMNAPTEWARRHDILGKNSYTKRIPQSVMRSGPSAWAHFLGGYFGADGGVASRKGLRPEKPRDDVSIGFSSVSRDLLVDCQTLLARLGISARLRRDRTKMETKAQPGGVYYSYVLTITDWHNASIFRERIDVRHSKIDRMTRTFRQRFDGEKYIADCIASVEEVESRGHRCFDIEEDDSFTIEDVVVSNTKSRFGSIYGPANYLGHHPNRKVMVLGPTQELVSGFGREVRNIVSSEEYREVFPGVSVSQDSRAADRWSTTAGGEFLARGVGGSVVGKGADLQITDDPHTEQEAALAAHNPKVFDNVYDWYLAGPRQRLQPGAAIELILTRWGKRDLQGRILQDAIDNGSIDEWKIFEFPALMPETEEHPQGWPLWPEYWSLDELLAVKRDLPVWRWNAQYQQRPTSDEGAIVKREWWKPWEGKLPEFIYLIQSWDTAFTANNYSDYSACTTWGVFYHDNEKGRRIAQVMLIDAWRDRVEFPELKARARELMNQHNPQTILIEARSSGPSLIQELRSMGIMVEEATPSRGKRENPNNKLARLNAVSDLFKSGFVWYKPGRITEAVIEEMAEYPSGDYDDLMDSGTQALQRLRNGGFIGSASDERQLYEESDPDDAPRRRPARRLY